MADIQYILRLYPTGTLIINNVQVDHYDYTNAEIGINPTISKTMCSGGYSVGNVATASLIVTIPDGLGWDEGCRVELLVDGSKLMGDWWVGTIEPLGFGRNKITCYDRMSKADDYLDFGSTTTVNGTGLTQLICDKIGATMSDPFANSLSIPVADIKSATMRDMLSIMAKHEGCNVAMKNNEIIKIPLYYSNNVISPTVHTSVSNVKSVSFTKTIFNTNSEIFSSGNGTPENTLIVNDKYGTQEQADIIQENMNNNENTYSSFNCEKCLLNHYYHDVNNILTFADVGDTFNWSNYTASTYKIMSMELYLSKAGIYATLSADTQKKTLNDNNNLSNSSSSGGGDLPAQITNFVGVRSTENTSNIILTWNNPASNFSGVTIKRKKGTPVSSIFDGEIIYANGGNTLTDTLPLPYYDYYYRSATWLGDYWNGTDNWVKIAALERGKYLYNVGDKCTALTGGWGSGNSVVAPNLVSGTATFNADHVLLNNFVRPTSNYRLGGVRTVNKINFDGFTKICAEVEITDITVYDVSAGYGDNTVNTQGTPYFSYADAAVSAADYPYVVCTYRSAGAAPLNYMVYLCQNKPAFYFNNDVASIFLYGSKIRLIYKGDTQAFVNKTDFAMNRVGLALYKPIGVPNLFYGNYMGGGYTNGYDNAYCMSVNPDIVPDGRVFVGTLHDNSYMYSNCVSFQKGTTVGNYVIKANIVDADSSTVPPIRTNYVCVGGFESNVKVKAVWLEP